MASQNVSTRTQQWLVMDITSLVTRWLQQPHTNQGVRIRTGTRKDKLKGLMESSLFEHNLQNTAFAPVLVLYTNESDNMIRSMAAGYVQSIKTLRPFIALLSANRPADFRL